MRITTKFVATIDLPGKYADDGAPGLFLLVREHTNKRTGATFLRKSFVQRLTIHGKRVDLGLGSPKWGATTVSQARAKALANYRIARNGGDPRNGHGAPTFRAALDAVLKIQREGWRDASKSEAQWRASLDTYAATLMHRPVDRITAADILACLAPHWHDRAETMRRVRQRIGVVMRWAATQGHRGDDPSHAVGAALPKQNGNHRNHHKALPHAQVGAAVAKVRESCATTAAKLCFEFAVLTAARSGEARLATWQEIDFEAAMWTVPAERMKAGKAHRVPLSNRALAILHEARDVSDDTGLIFPAPTGKALSDSTLSKLLRELDVRAVPHGFRASFRMWCADTGLPRELAEACLAHVVKGVEGAYQRSDLLERRRLLMEEWALYVGSSNIVALRATS